MNHGLPDRWEEAAASALGAMTLAAQCAGIYETRRSWAGGEPVVGCLCGQRSLGVWLEAAEALGEVFAGWVAVRLHLDCGTGDVGEVAGYPGMARWLARGVGAAVRRSRGHRSATCWRGLPRSMAGRPGRTGEVRNPWTPSPSSCPPPRCRRCRVGHWRAWWRGSCSATPASTPGAATPGPAGVVYLLRRGRRRSPGRPADPCRCLGPVAGSRRCVGAHGRPAHRLVVELLPVPGRRGSARRFR